MFGVYIKLLTKGTYFWQTPVLCLVNFHLKLASEELGWGVARA